MKRSHKTFILFFSIFSASCTTTSKVAQTVFTPDHYNPPTIYAEGDKADELLIDGPDKKSSHLNFKNPVVKKFKNREENIKNNEFIRVAYLYLISAQSQCERRVADINRARSASNSGFGMLTTVSAIAGTAIGTTSGANAASGAAAVFNSLTNNANAFQSQIISQYSGNIATVITNKQNEMIEGKLMQNGLRTKDNIKAKLNTLARNLENEDVALQSEIYYDLIKLNRACTVSAGQREIGEKLSG